MHPSTSRPLDAIFRPRSVAVVGASRSAGSLGRAIVHNLIEFGFEGAIYPVNPNVAALHSLRCYPSLSAIPDPVDLVVVVVPKPLVAATIDEGLARGVGGFVVITAGFGETGAAGRVEELALRERVRAAGIRMIGPNCMGVINTETGVRLNATFSPAPPLPGSIGFVSQSGALGVAILNVAQELGIGLTQFVSMGNKADVSGNDLLEHWEDDPATRVIALYLESFGNPRRFTEIAKRIGRKKPILVVKSGRTAAGARAASSHTGALAGADVTVSAFLDQCGVVRAETIQEMFDVARAFDRCPLPRGNRVAVVTNAGGPGIMATDACVNLGLEMATLSETTRGRLAEVLPAAAALANPVDMIASAGVAEYGATVASVLEDEGVDAALVIHVTPILTDPRDVLDEVGRIAAGHAKPVLAVMMASESFYEGLKGAPSLPPVYRFPEPAARALAQLVRYTAWRARPLEESPTFAFDETRIAAALAAAGEDGHLPPGEAFALLAACGIPVARYAVAADEKEAVAAAARIGFPVVVKAIAPGLVHKTEAKAVVLDLEDERETAAACAELASRLAAAGSPVEGFLVQEMARGGHETIFGISTDGRYGPVLMFGLGGKYVEVFRDVRFGVPPMTATDAREMVRGIRGVRLLEGVRGEPGADREQLAEILLRLSQLAQTHPELLELDVNPFLASADAAASRALDVRVRVAVRRDDPAA